MFLQVKRQVVYLLFKQGGLDDDGMTLREMKLHLKMLLQNAEQIAAIHAEYAVRTPHIILNVRPRPSG